MKIGLINEKFISRGGLEKYLFNFASQLVADGHEVHVITQHTDAATSRIDARFHRLPHPPLLPPALRLIRFSRDAAVLVRELNLDVSIGFGRTTTQDFHRAGGGCHRLYSGLLNPAKRIGLKNQVELHLEKKLYTGGGTAHFVVNSAQVGRQLEEAYGVLPEKCSVIHTAVDTDRLRPAECIEDKARLRTELEPSLGPETDVFLFVSRSHRRKGLDALLHAWTLLRRLRRDRRAELWILGAPVKSRYRRLVSGGGLGDVVRAFDSDREVLPFYQAADFFVHPTLYDACANTVLESMACGLPGIISAADGAIEFVEHGSTGLRLERPSDAGEIRDLATEAMGLSPEDRQRMGQAARDRVLPLTWRAHVDRWMEVIGHL